MPDLANEREARPVVLVWGSWLLDLIPDWEDVYRLVPCSTSGLPAEAGVTEVLVWDGSPLPTSVLDRLPGLRLIAGLATGYGGVSLPDLRARGIVLTNGAGANAHDVADHAIALLLSFWHGLALQDWRVRSGEWQGDGALRRSLRGRRIGIVGLGRIGTAVAERMAPHQVEIRWWGPRARPDATYPRAESLVDLADWADVLVVASRATEGNRRQIDEPVLDALGPAGILVNVSRGMLVDEAALLARLRSGRLGGAALDVFEQEPVDPVQWRDVPNTLLTPHVAGATCEGVHQLLAQLRANVDRHFAGEPLLTPVTDAG